MPEPVEHALESVLGIGGVALEALAVLVLDVVKSNVAPLLLAVVNVPLVKKSDRAVAMLVGNSRP